MHEIVKYVPESMRIPSSTLKLQDAVGQGNSIISEFNPLSVSSSLITLICSNYILGAFGIVYKGLLIDWNNVAIRGVALKTLKGNIFITISLCYYNFPLVSNSSHFLLNEVHTSSL